MSCQFNFWHTCHQTAAPTPPEECSQTQKCYRTVKQEMLKICKTVKGGGWKTTVKMWGRDQSALECTWVTRPRPVLHADYRFLRIFLFLFPRLLVENEDLRQSGFSDPVGGLWAYLTTGDNLNKNRSTGFLAGQTLTILLGGMVPQYSVTRFLVANFGNGLKTNNFSCSNCF